MGVSSIDGTIEDAVFGGGYGGAGIRKYKHITFRLADGSRKSVAKVIAHNQIAEHLKPGASGRFYLYTAVDQRGIHGVRDREGQSLFRYPRNIELGALLIVLIFGLFSAVDILVWGDVPRLPGLLLILTAIYWFFSRKTRREAQRQFDADSGYAPAAATTGEIQPAIGA